MSAALVASCRQHIAGWFDDKAVYLTDAYYVELARLIHNAYQSNVAGDGDRHYWDIEDRVLRATHKLLFFHHMSNDDEDEEEDEGEWEDAQELVGEILCDVYPAFRDKIYV
jgi:hypothetical protein